jgi:muconolactone delta-isomerase
MTPGQYRSHARFLRDEASDLRRMAAGTPIRHWRDKWIRDADRCEEDAAWYDQAAGRGEIEVEYVDVTHYAEAAE